MKLEKIHTLDLECTVSEPSHCWLACSVKLSKLDIKHVKTMFNIEDVVNFIFNVSNDNHIFYCHNLKYDISFILSYLFKFHRGEFLITEKIIMPLTKSIFKITIIFKETKVTFKDSYPLFASPLSKVLEAFTDLEKGETPIYKTLNEVEYSSYNIEYCKIDALGLAIALTKRFEYGRGALTTASGSFKEFKYIINDKFNNGFNKFFPLIDYEVQKDLRLAYRGGFTYLNEYFKEVKLYNINQIDVNSMYPAQMYKKPLPYDEPIYCDGEVIVDELYNLGVQKFSIESAIIKDGKVPFLTNSNTMLATAVYRDVVLEDEPIEKRTFSLTLDELDLFKNSYDYKGLEYISGYKFKSREDLFIDYINKFWELKISDNPTIVAIGKLFLNALYGKMSENYEKETIDIDYNNKLTFSKETIENVNPVGYLPVGLFVTSYARLYLINAILKIGFDNFVYCDTDSIHYLNSVDINKLELDLDNKKLGAWGVKGLYKKAYYVRSKRYIGLKAKDNKLDIACAGIKKNDIIKVIKSVDDFRQGVKIPTIEFKHGVNGQYTRDKVIEI